MVPNERLIERADTQSNMQMPGPIRNTNRLTGDTAPTRRGIGPRRSDTSARQEKEVAVTRSSASVGHIAVEKSIAARIYLRREKTANGQRHSNMSGQGLG